MFVPVARIADLPVFGAEMARNQMAPNAELAGANSASLSVYFWRSASEGRSVLQGFRAERFVVPLPAETLRVVMLGESSVEGFPMPRNLAASEFLRVMFRRLAPEKKVEVINLGVRGIASFPMRKIAEEALRCLQPSLLVVYAGHNEIYGAFGVGSFESAGASPALMSLFANLRRTALIQAAQKLSGMFRATDADREQIKSFGEIMSQGREIPPDSPLRARAQSCLSGNLRAIVSVARAHGVPVVVSTVASNERDFAPMGSSEIDLAPDMAPSWRARFAAADTTACAELEQLVVEAPRHALARYRLGQCLAAAGQTSAAAGEFRMARDLDVLPWRATRAINSEIRKTAADEKAILADAEAAFAADANGPPGRELFEDHLHPSLPGQALLARTIVGALRREGFLTSSTAADQAPSWRKLAEELGWNPLEDYRVARVMAAYMHEPPLKYNNGAAARRVDELIAEMENGFDVIDTSAAAEWKIARQTSGVALPISYFGGCAALRARDYARARAYFAGAVGNAAPFSDERCAARCLHAAAAARCDGAGGAAARVLLDECIMEARSVERLQGQPTALLARTLACLLRMADRPDEALNYDNMAAQLALNSTPYMRAFLGGLQACESLSP